MSLQEQLETLKSQTLAKIEAADELSIVEKIRVETLGKKGPITEVLRGMRDLSAEERPKVGAFANEIRDLLTNAVEERKAALAEAALEKQLAAEAID
ncbi:MAG: phenylalanine--tRNA ligase subunit alpha, partial [Enterococcus sp.]|nr:phenylalanine--tRNA ligase subunit alpha [Enterococcus sp.]